MAQGNIELRSMTGSTRGTQVTLELNTMYDCETDGYLIARARNTDGIVGVEYYDSTGTAISDFFVNGETNSTISQSIYIKRGMKVKMIYKAGTHTVNDAFFIPLV